MLPPGFVSLEPRVSGNARLPAGVFFADLAVVFRYSLNCWDVLGVTRLRRGGEVTVPTKKGVTD